MNTLDCKNGFSLSIFIAADEMFIALIYLAFSFFGNWDMMMQEANASLEKGENAANYNERKQALNHALYVYSLIEQQTSSPSPSLSRVIGDIYLQLGEYPWAVFYYQKTLKIDPSDSLAAAHLEIAHQKLGIADDSSLPKQQNTIANLLSALATCDALVFWAILLTFAACSLSIWLPYRQIRFSAAACSLLLLLLLLNSAVFYYSAPLEGILVAPTGFYRTPDKNQPQLTPMPLFAGSRVNVLQMTSDGNWVKITNDAGLVGYIPSSYVRLI